MIVRIQLRNTPSSDRESNIVSLICASVVVAVIRSRHLPRHEEPERR